MKIKIAKVRKLCTGPLNDWTTFAYVSINILEPLWKGGLGGNNV